MADSNIGALPLAASVADDSLLVMEQQGTAMKVTGRLLKDYAKQGVEMEFQGYLDEAKDAADRAAEAVSTVTNMTVEARTLDSGQPATVTKSVRGGVVNLAFGLPRGEQGVPGPEGKTGPRGPQGAPGTGLDILGHYDTEGALRAAITAPEVGDAYGVGQETPYEVYVFDGVTLDWKNYGQLGGGGGGILPENVVTSEGGASLEIPAYFGDTPHVVTFTDEEEPPLTAEDIVYGDETVKEAIDGLKSSVSDGKQLVASAITGKGVATPTDATFTQMAENIGKITTGADTQDATATPGDILAPKTAYTKSGKVTGIIPSLPAQTIMPGTADKTLANGQYLAGTQTIKGDPNLTSSNIKKGVTLFGVTGAMKSSFAGVLTVTADVGAVVTATHTNGTKVEALSTTGTVTMELPIEGAWKVTAVRGVAQYNAVTIEVSSHYSAALTAQLHIEYYIAAAPLRDAYSAVAVSMVEHALFIGALQSYYQGPNGASYSVVDAYNADLVRAAATDIVPYIAPQAGTVIESSWGNFALVAGYTYQAVTEEYVSLVMSYAEDFAINGIGTLSVPRVDVAATTIGGYALFGGGIDGMNTTPTTVVDVYDQSLTRIEPRALLVSHNSGYLSKPAAVTVGSYALFGGGAGRDGMPISTVEAFDSSLTRSAPTALSEGMKAPVAANAGSYALFCYGKTLNAYDLFLTRTTPQTLSISRFEMAATTLKGFAVFGGGRVYSDGNYTASEVVDVYDPYLVHTTPKGLSTARHSLVAASVGDYALFGGGITSQWTTGSPARSDVVDAYRYV